MSRLSMFFIAALPFVESPAIAAGPVAPEPAPPAQRVAPPDKIAPPMHTKSAKPETTGEAPKELKPDHGENTEIKRAVPSSPANANKCAPGKDQIGERKPPPAGCP